MSFQVPNLGHGIGLRTQHYKDFLAEQPNCAWCEVITENFIVPGGRPRAVLEKVRSERPVVMHGVSLSIGGSDPLNAVYLQQVKDLAACLQPAWVSDHLCWGTHQGRYAHDLLPLPFTEEALTHVCTRVRQVQDILGRQILLENVSSYVQFHASTLTEWEFMAAVAERADCGLLLDVNNVYVSGRNHGFAPTTFIDGIPASRVGQLHLAGHSTEKTFLLDTHDGPVCDEVWTLYRYAIERLGPVSTLIEWDDAIPSLDVVLGEADKARRICESVVPPKRQVA